MEQQTVEEERVAVDASIMQRILRGIRGEKLSKSRNHGPQGKQATPGQEGRWKRRLMARYEGKPDPRTQPHARLGRAKMIRPQFMLAAEARAEADRILKRAKIEMMLADCPEMKYVQGAFKNAFQLANASTPHIRSIPGFGPARRRKVYDYLKAHNVVVHWEP